MRATDLVTIGGLPAHPLIVHAVVVLLPLAALGAVSVACVPRWRRRYGWPVLGLILVAVIAVPLAQQSGEQLRDALSGVNNPLITRHANLGDDLLPFALALAITVVALIVAGRLADRERATVDKTGSAKAETDETALDNRKPATWRRIALVVSVLVIAAAVTTTVVTIRIGHSGSTAVWEGVAR